MPPTTSARTIPLPRRWPSNIKSAILATISLAHLAVCHARGWAADAVNPRARQAAEIERLTAEISLLREELAIKDGRIARTRPWLAEHRTKCTRPSILPTATRVSSRERDGHGTQSVPRRTCPFAASLVLDSNSSSPTMRATRTCPSFNSSRSPESSVAVRSSSRPRSALAADKPCIAVIDASLKLPKSDSPGHQHPNICRTKIAGPVHHYSLHIILPKR